MMCSVTPMQGEGKLISWMEEAEQLSILLANIENLLSTMERGVPRSVETNDLKGALKDKTKELFDKYRDMKDKIRSELLQSPEEMQEKYRMWTV